MSESRLDKTRHLASGEREISEHTKGTVMLGGHAEKKGHPQGRVRLVDKLLLLIWVESLSAPNWAKKTRGAKARR